MGVSEEVFANRPICPHESQASLPVRLQGLRGRSAVHGLLVLLADTDGSFAVFAPLSPLFQITLPFLLVQDGVVLHVDHSRSTLQRTHEMGFRDGDEVWVFARLVRRGAGEQGALWASGRVTVQETGEPQGSPPYL